VDAPRILLIRTSALGDIVHALPALTALRRHLPKARIAWVVEKAFAPLLESHADLDQVLTINTKGWRQRPLAAETWREMGRFMSELDGFGAEIALDLMGNYKGTLIAMLALCDRRIGISKRWRREPASAAWLTDTVPPNGRHAVNQALAVAGALGLPTEPADFGGDRLGSSSQLSDETEDCSVILHPGTGWANKTYPPERWGEVTRLIAKETGRDTWVSAGPGENRLADRVVSSSQGHAHCLDDPSLDDLVERLRHADLVLGGDTGPIHLAHALGVSVLSVMGPTDPERNGPYGAPERTVSQRLPCSFCHRRLDSVKACLLEIPPHLVASRAVELLRESMRSSSGTPRRRGEAGPAGSREAQARRAPWDTGP